MGNTKGDIKMDSVLTSRQERERNFYNKYAQKNNSAYKTVDISPMEKIQRGLEMRPWNSYWSIYSLAINNYFKEAKLLDFGTGPGKNALRFASIGYKVNGFDISEENIKIAKKLFKENNKEANFDITAAESLPYENNTFNMVIGVDILHHIDIEQSLLECRRVLKKNGIAIFREPVEVPILDKIRNTKIVKYFFPKHYSLENHITHDESKISRQQELVIKKIFPNTKKHYFLLFARFDKFYRKNSSPKASIIEKIDYYIFKLFPFMKKYAGAVIYEFKK